MKKARFPAYALGGLVEEISVPVEYQEGLLTLDISFNDCIAEIDLSPIHNVKALQQTIRENRDLRRVDLRP